MREGTRAAPVVTEVTVEAVEWYKIQASKLLRVNSGTITTSMNETRIDHRFRIIKPKAERFCLQKHSELLHALGSDLKV